MSEKQYPSSKKSKTTKSGIKQKYRGFILKIKKKLRVIYDKLIHQEVYVDGQEPPKSYSFNKKFFGLYIIFLIYSFLLIWALNDPRNSISAIFMFGNDPKDILIFGNTMVAFFLVLSVLFSIDKLRLFIFEENTIIKQILLYCGLFTGLYFIFLYFSIKINYTTYLLALAMIWLFLLSSRFYIYSRKFSTKIESRFIKKYSIPRYGFAIITPFIILFILVIISLFYRTFLVFLSLDFFGPRDPVNAVDVYRIEMHQVMPLIYFSLVMTLVFIIFEFVSTRRRAETRRAGTFDNFTFSLIILFIFFFQIFQISIYLLLQEDTVDAFRASIGVTGSPVTFLFIFEFAVSMYFLYRIIKKTGGTLGWRILFFKKDGLIVFFLACVFAQTLTRFSLASDINNQVLTGVGGILMRDKYIISVLMIFFLGTTLLVYYIKPHETSMFMRLQKETVSEEEKELDRVYKIIRSEYIRRGEAYPIEIIERELIKATQLSKTNVYSLIEHLARKDMDILISMKKNDLGKPTKMIDFVSVTERFEKKGVAEQKAKKYLSERLFQTALQKETRTSRLRDVQESGAPSSSFISSLTSDYSRKQVDKEKFLQRLKDTDLSFKPEDLPRDLKEKMIDIIKKEYMYRIETPEKNPDFYIPFSEISKEVESNLNINPGEMYSILEDLNKKDIELKLIDNPDQPEDKKIKFLPYADDNMNFSLANFRPEEYSKFRITVTNNLLKNLKSKRDKRGIFQLKKQIPDQTANQKSWFGLLNNLYFYYPEYVKKLETIPNKSKLMNQMKSIIKVYEKKHA